MRFSPQQQQTGYPGEVFITSSKLVNNCYYFHVLCSVCRAVRGTRCTHRVTFHQTHWLWVEFRDVNEFVRPHFDSYSFVRWGQSRLVVFFRCGQNFHFRWLWYREYRLGWANKTGSRQGKSWYALGVLSLPTTEISLLQLFQWCSQNLLDETNNPYWAASYKTGWLKNIFLIWKCTTCLDQIRI